MISPFKVKEEKRKHQKAIQRGKLWMVWDDSNEWNIVRSYCLQIPLPGGTEWRWSGGEVAHYFE